MAVVNVVQVIFNMVMAKAKINNQTNNSCNKDDCYQSDNAEAVQDGHPCDAQRVPDGVDDKGP